MRFLKLGIISVVVLFSLLTAFSFLLPSDIRISRAIDISTNINNVRDQLLDIEKWDQWNEYVKTLPGKQILNDTIRSKNLVVWVTKAGASEVETKWLRENGKSFPGIFVLISNQSVTTVQWYFKFSFKWYPWEKFSSIVYDQQLGPQMEQSLINLKKLLEEGS